MHDSCAGLVREPVVNGGNVRGVPVQPGDGGMELRGVKQPTNQPASQAASPER